MKANKFLAIACGALLLLGSCTDKDKKREPSPAFEGTAEVYFPETSISKELDPADGITSWKIAIARKDTIGELTVPVVVVQNDSDIFDVPDTITFADQVKTDTIVINFPDGKEGITYALKLTVSDKVINPYSSTVSECNFSFVNLAWKKADFPAVIIDAIIGIFYGVPEAPFYANYEYVNLSDGSSKYRFKNPYASHPSTFDPVSETSTPDRYGVYDGYPFNYPEDYDTSKDYNMIINVDKDGNASIPAFETGIIWSFGMFAGGSTNLMSDEYPAGVLEDEVITFSGADGAIWGSSETYPGPYLATTDMIIYLDGKKYQESHSVKRISDFEDKFNDQTEMEWVDSVAGTSLFQSAAFEQNWDQVLRKAVDIDSINGDESEFKNLWSLPDLYAEGYCLAFYWNQEKGKITIPADQPTGQKYAGKKIMMGPSSTDCTIEQVTVSGTNLTKFTFGIALTTEDGSLIGEYEEVFYIGEQINWSIDSYVGTFEVNEKYVFDGSDWTDTVAISKVDETTILIEGFDYCSGLTATFDDETKTLSLAPQIQDTIYDAFDITFLTLDATGYPSETEPIVLQMNMDGTISYAATTGAFGYMLYSETYAEYEAESYGYLDGYYDQVFTPIVIEPKEAPVRKMMASKSNFRKHGAIKPVAHKAGKQLSTNGFRIQSKAPRYFMHKDLVRFF